jgi:predicted NBD/HSP70 family sugar kinase
VTRATASALVDELLAGEFVREVAMPRSSQSGRPATGLTLATGTVAALGVEINVDYLAAMVVDLTGAVGSEEFVDVDNRDRPADQVLSDARGLARRALRKANGGVVGAAIAVPGLLQDDLLLAPNLGWEAVDVKQAMRLDVPVTLDNEANFAALSEVGPELRSFVHISGEVGIGAGVVIDGALFRGSRGWSGEIGHLTVVPDGPRCHCGARGCLEVYAGQDVLARSGPEAIARPLGIALAGMLNILDIGSVLLGGVFAEHSEALVPAIQTELDTRVLWSSLAPPQVLVARNGRRAACRGAAASVINDVLAFAS